MVLITVSSFYFRGDDLGDLTESLWPDLYESTGRLSDLTGRIQITGFFEINQSSS